MKSEKIFVAGIPRSGTTWLSKVLSQSPNYKYIHEPDNERHTYTAFYYKRGLERFPYFDKYEKSGKYLKIFTEAFFGSHINMDSKSNELLFRLASFNKGKIEKWLQEDNKNPYVHTPEHLLYPLLHKSVYPEDNKRIVKSVHAALSLSYILQNIKIPTVVILRHPASIISSYLNLANEDIDRKLYLNKKLINDHFKDHFPNLQEFSSSLNYAGLQIAILFQLLHKAIETHIDIKLVFHEDLCASPVEAYKDIFNFFDLEWKDSIEEYILHSNESGSGYDTKRIAKKNINIWKERLSPLQISEIQKGYSSINTKYYKDFG